MVLGFLSLHMLLQDKFLRLDSKQLEWGLSTIQQRLQHFCCRILNTNGPTLICAGLVPLRIQRHTFEFSKVKRSLNAQFCIAVYCALYTRLCVFYTIYTSLSTLRQPVCLWLHLLPSISGSLCAELGLPQMGNSGMPIEKGDLGGQGLDG